MAKPTQEVPPPPPPQWAIDLNSPTPKPSRSANSIPDPPGYSAAKSATKQQRTSKNTASSSPTSTSTTSTTADNDTLKLKKAWELAIAPAKQIPMQAIMMYMGGNSLQIFSIMMVFMLFKGPMQGLLNTNAAFARFETEGTKTALWGVKAVYVLMQILLLGLGVWKVNGMGLLPTTRSDWLAWEFEREPVERAYFAFN